MTAASVTPAPLLRRNRDFQLLWLGQAISGLGSWASSVSLPLVVLSLTGSPVDAGIVSFAFGICGAAVALPAGSMLDRADRRRAMVAIDCVRCAAAASVALALWLGRPTLVQLVAVAAIEGAGFTAFAVAQQAALKQLVPPARLPDALTRFQAREHGSILVGPPLGGLLYGLGRAVPFVADAISYAVSVWTLRALRTPLQEAAREPGPRASPDGARWLWRQPFLRVATVLGVGSTFVVNAVYLFAVVVARRHGASAAAVGAMLMLLGLGGVAGSAAAGRLARRLSVRQVVALTMVVPALLVPLVASTTDPYALGALLGGMVALHPTWAAVVGARFVELTPDALQARTQGVLMLVSLGPVPFGRLGVGFLLAALGRGVTVACLAVLMAMIALAAVAHPDVRSAR